MNPLREIRMLGQDRPLDEIAAEIEAKPRVHWSVWRRDDVHWYRAQHAGELGYIEGCAATRELAVDFALEAKRRLETGLPG